MFHISANISTFGFIFVVLLGFTPTFKLHFIKSKDS